MNGTLMAFLIVCVVCMTICKVATANVKHRDKAKYNEDETRIIQEMHRNLERMEDRIEALETLLMEHQSRRREFSEFR